MDELKYLFKNKPFDFIGINETKLTNNMLGKDFELDGYTLFRADRKMLGKKPVGGCALYVRDNITSFVEKTELIPQGLEGLCGTVTLPNKANYWSPISTDPLIHQ